MKRILYILIFLVLHQGVTGQNFYWSHRAPDEAEPVGYTSVSYGSIINDAIYRTDPIVDAITIPSGTDLVILSLYEYHGEPITGAPTISNNTLTETLRPESVLDAFSAIQEMHSYYIINPTTGSQTLTIPKPTPSNQRYQLTFFETEGEFEYLGADTSNHLSDTIGKAVVIQNNVTNLVYFSVLAVRNYDLPRYSITDISQTYNNINEGVGGGVIGFENGYKIVDATQSTSLIQKVKAIDHFQHLCQYIIFKVNAP
ncbi:hypothetical protein [Draconibacterium sediminis]|uniref:Uncharacterized protein n=1 Tax=Draconibacterium sediminis TaxID=1544798 RepID=A0A0D8JCB2_9BACT|nr:hypothetical protein [Draconibacterium sediminis]KJF44161.1 hypothetical protein LH29_01130 [Draconibacterium sediminis]